MKQLASLLLAVMLVRFTVPVRSPVVRVGSVEVRGAYFIKHTPASPFFVGAKALAPDTCYCYHGWNVRVKVRF